jgi:nuclear distribution protein NudE
MSLQTNHNTTTASLQRELDSLRQENQKMKVQLRELEMGNDDLERNERAVASSLSDVESKYARALEEKILLEHELLDKAHLEEECQRLKDELRGTLHDCCSFANFSHFLIDSNAEISVLRDQLAAAQARASSQTLDSFISARTPSEGSSSLVPNASKSLEDNLLHTRPPPDLELPEFPPERELPPVPDAPRPSTSSADSESGQSVLLHRAGFPFPRHRISSPQTPVSLSRSSTLPSLSTASRIPPRTIVNRSTSQATTSSTTSATTSSGVTTTSKSRGVQMVSEMRARVKNLEQKIHTRVPRLRMGSMSRPNPSVTTSNSKSSSLSSAGGSQSIKSPDERPRPSLLGRRPADNDENKRTPANSSGWVLIMEDSPSPTKLKDKEHRRASSPPSAAGFRAFASLVDSPHSGSLSTPAVPSQNVHPSGLRRPQSRLSTSTEGRSSVSTTATVSSIPTPVSRPATPTFIPLPTSGLYAHPSTAGAAGLKRPSGPGIGGTYLKRSSLGSNTGDSPSSGNVSDSGISHAALSTSATYVAPSPTSSSLSQIQVPHSNVTVRSHSKLPTPTATPLSQSRIGRPSIGFSGRRSAGAELSDVEGRFLDTRDKGRRRSGSRS